MATDPNPIKTKIETLIDNLCKLTDEAAKSDALANFLASIARFYHYSYFNAMLILIANPNATQVAGYNAWLKFHRYVKRGEKGIPILAPIIIKPKDEPDETRKKLVGFRTVYVFDISQTDGEPLPEMPDWKSPAMLESIHARLLDFASSKGITVDVQDINNGAQGYSARGKIVLDTTAGTKTLVHEIAHELLHQIPDKIRPSHQVMEVEAESIAYVVCSFFGLSDLASPNYLALWHAEPKTIKASLVIIQQTAAQIINYINPQPKSEE
jgi:hypothetical protein